MSSSMPKSNTHTHNNNNTNDTPIYRSSLKCMKRILIKIGTSVVINQDGSVALGRLGHLVEQIVDLLREGKEVILVSSGAVGVGNLKIQQNLVLSMPLRAHVNGNIIMNASKPSVCAATGQSGLMALYEMLFGHKQVSCSQILLTSFDLREQSRRDNLRDTINTLLSLGIVPIINENDVIQSTVNQGNNDKALFWDNDSLACLLSKEMDVELMLMLSDVDGLYKAPPVNNIKPEVVHSFVPGKTDFTIGSKSKNGRGGMESKLNAALSALAHVRAVVIASGYKLNTITQVVNGELVGTLLASNIPNNEETTLSLAEKAKSGSRILQTRSTEERSEILLAIAENLKDRENDILDANMKDLSAAQISGLSSALLSRLKLTPKKIETLVKGLIQLANASEPLGNELHSIELADDMILSKQTVPLGVLLVIFESRPDVLPQVAGLAIKSGNGLILKGGKEASFSNQILHEVIVEGIDKGSNGNVPKGVIGLVESRAEVKSLLSMDEHINLVIPRGSADLVRYIQDTSKIPVLGHADGICHIYIDEDASLEKALKIVLDAKTDYPSACNAVETVLIHEKWPVHNVQELVKALNEAKVNLYGGEKSCLLLNLPQTPSFKMEYGDLSLTIEFVESIDDAITHIHTYGSGHTEAIITESKENEQRFLNEVDSACVFANASTRFADGFRFGLGAEVGISTSKIHARGPVGIEGLLSSKWKLVSTDEKGSIASDFSSGKKSFTHKVLKSRL